MHPYAEVKHEEHTSSTTPFGVRNPSQSENSRANAADPDSYIIYRCSLVANTPPLSSPREPIPSKGFAECLQKTRSSGKYNEQANTKER